MTRNVLIFGIIMGTIITGNMVDQVSSNPDVETNEVIGYAAVVIVFSLTFFGIRNYRNKDLKGVISEVLPIGLAVALISSLALKKKSVAVKSL